MTKPHRTCINLNPGFIAAEVEGMCSAGRCQGAEAQSPPSAVQGVESIAVLAIPLACQQLYPDEDVPCAFHTGIGFAQDKLLRRRNMFHKI